jgi:prophage regulatory protein
MTTTFLSDTQIAARYGVHRSTPWRWAKTDPTFPQPVTLTAGCTRWKLSELEAWEAAKTRTA